MRILQRWPVFRDRAGTAALLYLAVLAWGCDRGGESKSPPSAPVAAPSSAVQVAAEPAPAQSESKTSVDTPAVGGPATSRPGTESAPASDSSSGSVPAFEPLTDAAVGEWARLAAMGGREILYEITEVRAATVTIRVTAFQQGKPLGSPALREDFKDMDPVAVAVAAVKAVRTTGKVAVELAGRTWDATFYEDQWTDEGVQYVRRTWVSPEAPVFGTLKMELYGDGKPEAALELMAGGRK